MLDDNDYLPQHQEALEVKIWIEAQLYKFDNILRASSTKSLVGFCDTVINTIAKEVEAIKGIFYIIQDEEVKPMAGYACNATDLQRKNLKLGEGLIGQVAKNKEPIYLQNLSQEHFYTSAASEHIYAQSLLLLPLTFNANNYGVVELLFINNPNERALELLKRLANNIATMLQSIISNAHTKNLLEISLKQTKALQEKEKELQQLVNKVNRDKEKIEANNRQLAEQINFTERLQQELATRTKIINQVAIVTETDIYGTITYANEKFCEISKYKAEELIGKPHNIIRHPENSPALFKEMWATIQAGKVFYATYRNKAKDGTTYWVEAMIAPIMNENEEIIKYVGVRFDVTEKINRELAQEDFLLEIKQQKEALLASEEELRQNLEELQTTQEQLVTSKDLFENKQKQLQRFLNSIPSYLYEAELDLATQVFHIRLNNKAGEEIYGISQTELEQNGGSIFRVILPEDVAILQNAIVAAINTQQSQRVEYRIKKGEEIRWLQGTMLPNMTAHHTVLFTGVVQDITAYKIAEQKIKEQHEILLASEANLRQNLEELQATQELLATTNQELVFQSSFQQAILANADVIIISTDINGTITSFNKKAEQLLGYTAEEVVNKASPAIFHDLNEIVARAKALTQELGQEVPIGFDVFVVKSSLGLPNTYEWTYNGKNGEKYTIELAVSSLKDKEGTVFGYLGIATDITAKKIAAQNQILLQKLINNTGDAIQACAEDGRFVYMNTIAAQRFGIKAEDCGNYFVKDLEAVFAEEGSWEAHVAELKALKSLVVESANTNQQTGETVFVEVSVQYIEIDTQGFMVATSRNISERKKQEQLIKQQNEALLASEEELRQNLEELQATQEKLITLQEEERKANEVFKALFEYSTNPHLLFDETGIIDCNNATIQLLGYQSKIEILKLHPAKLSPERQPDGRLSGEKAVEMDRIAHEKGYHRFEWIHRKVDSTDFPVEVTLNPIQLNGKDVLLVVWHDLTERKKAEAEIRQNLEELQSTQENLQKQKTALEETLQELKNAQGQLVQAEKMATLGQLVASIAHEINTPLGAIRSSAGNATAVLQQTLPSLPKFFRQLTDTQVELFEEFLTIVAQQNNLLSAKEERQIRRQLSRELEEQNIPDASEVAEMLVEMGIYENFNKFLPLLQDVEIVKMAHQLSGISRSNATINTATDRASKVVFALKNFARQDHSGQKSMANLNNGLETVLTLYQNQLKQGIDIIREYADLPEILCYPDELVQVWTNLVHNAIQAMNLQGTLRIMTQLQTNTIVVSVTDSGHGIPNDIKDKIFNAFFTTKKAGEGSGLGLDIVKKIIDKHNGKIYFETEIGKGTTFFVEIPVILEEQDK